MTQIKWLVPIEFSMSNKIHCWRISDHKKIDSWQRFILDLAIVVFCLFSNESIIRLVKYEYKVVHKFWGQINFVQFQDKNFFYRLKLKVLAIKMVN